METIENSTQGIEEEIDIPYLWYDDDEWGKLMFHTRSQINAILNPLRAYGQDSYVRGAIEELMKLFDLFSQRVRGKDIPVMVRASPAPMPTEEVE